MIWFVEGERVGEYPALIDAMHRSRADIFGSRLGWDVEVVDGRERDRFDDCNPLYVICTDDDGNYRGSLRLLPTTGPNMLRDVFPQLLADFAGNGTWSMIESTTIWECSRICGLDSGTLNELLLGIAEVCLKFGLTKIVSVFDSRVLRVLKSRLAINLIGTSQNIGGVLCYVGLFDAGTREDIANFKRDRGLENFAIAAE
jgi:N-acyl-L-homoserine lactone synthetase